MARLFYLKVDGGKTGICECNGLNDYYKILECDCFDIAHLNIGGKYFDLFVDDNGLLKENQLPSAIDNDNNPLLVGNIIFANHDDEGRTTSLSDDDIELIKRNLINGIAFLEDGSEKIIGAVIASY